MSNPNAAAPSLIDLEGCLNFRDLGGYPTRDGRRVRRGRLYRSDALHHMTGRDVRHVRDRLGVRAIIDLRSSSELRSDGSGPLASAGVRHHHVPMFEDEPRDPEPAEAPDGLGQRYFLMLRHCHRALARALEIMARSSEPAVFHCAAGKDRTGVVSALLLGIAGVDEEHIVADYVFTSRNLARIIQRLLDSRSYGAVIRQLPPETLHAEPATMISLLARVRDEYGSMTGYALQAGVSDASLQRLRSDLVEEA